MRIASLVLSIFILANITAAQAQTLNNPYNGIPMR